VADPTSPHSIVPSATWTTSVRPLVLLPALLTKGLGLAGGARSAESLAMGEVPRAASELLDAADLYYQLHWSAIELRIGGKSNPGLSESVIRERALNRLTRYMDQGWDDVTTDT
jgi:hypothetical protein